MPDFRKGAKAAQEAAKFTRFQRTEFFNIKNKETAVLRFITAQPEWIVVDQHQFVPTKPAPADYKGQSWPNTMSAVCRQDKAFAEDGFADCFIHDFMKKPDGKPYPASGRGFAYACLREEVIENGQRVGYKDKTRTIKKTDAEGKPTGEEIEEKAIVVVNQGWKNFFSTLEGYDATYGTITDRDYFIRRKGEQLDTDYDIIPVGEPIMMGVKDEKGEPVLNNGQPVREILRGPTYKNVGDQDHPRYEVVDPGHPNWATRYATDQELADIVTQMASDDFYARFFDTRVSAPASAPAGNGQQAPSVPKPEADMDPEKLQNLRDRIKGYAANQEAPAASQGAQEPPQAQPAGVMRDFE